MTEQSDRLGIVIGGCMPRIVPLLMLVCVGRIASDFGSASAQPATLRQCNPRLNERLLRAGQFPDWVGCRFSDAQTILERYDYRALERPDEATTGIERGFITRQVADDGEVIFDVAGGAGYPPPPEPPPILPPTEVPTPPTAKPTFSIHAPQRIPEGSRLTFTIRREGNDGRPHRITLSTDPPELLQTALEPFDFGPDRTDQVITVATSRGKAGDGDHPIEISLSVDDTAGIADPGSAQIVIADVPAPVINKPPPDDQQPPQEDPRKTLLQRLNDQAPWWPIALAVLGVAAVAYAVRKIWPPAPMLYPSWALEAGLAPGETSAPRLIGWPKFSTRSELEWGGSIVPEPLPVAELDND